MRRNALFARGRGVPVPSPDILVVEGRITEPLPNALFRVQLDSGQEIVAHVAAKTRMHTVRMLPGDRVRVELSRFDQSRGRITERSRA
jgi:translation initiation factor IF-1